MNEKEMLRQLKAKRRLGKEIHCLRKKLDTLYEVFMGQNKIKAPAINGVSKALAEWRLGELEGLYERKKDTYDK